MLTCIKCGRSFALQGKPYKRRAKCYICSPKSNRDAMEEHRERAKRSARAYFNKLVTGIPDRRGLLTGERLLEMYEFQERKCAVTGLSTSHEHGRDDPYSANIDCIKPRSSGGTYHWSNVQLVCRFVQTMKLALDPKVFEGAILVAAEQIRGGRPAFRRSDRYKKMVARFEREDIINRIRNDELTEEIVA